MLELPIALRSAFDRLRFPERQRTTPEVRGFDTTSMPVDLDLPVRLYRPGEIWPVVTVHVTDVMGGFGVAAYQIAPWRKRLELGKVPAELLAQLPDPTDLGGSSYLLALLERYSRDAYHQIGSRRAGNVKNHPLTLRTSHGNDGNGGPGWALDCHHTEELTAELVAVGIASLADLVMALHTLTGKVVAIVPHRAWSSGRRVDPEVRVWQRVILAVVEQLGLAVVKCAYETKSDGGLPIPTTWDEHAHYDVKGRPVKAAA